MTDSRIERQSRIVARLAKELRFEVLMLQRMKKRAAPPAAAGHSAAVLPQRFASLADVYAAAVLRDLSETES